MNSQVGKSIGISLLLAAALIATLFAMSVFPVGAQAVPTLTVNPTTAMPGERIQVSGTNFDVTADAGTSTVTVYMRTAKGETAGQVALAPAAPVLGDGSFEAFYILPDGALTTHKVIEAVGAVIPGSSPEANESASTAFTVKIEATIRSISPAEVNNAVGGNTTVTVFGFTNGNGNVTVTATDKDGEDIVVTAGADNVILSASAGGEQTATINIPAGTTAGMITVTATQGTGSTAKVAVDDESLKVIAPTITLDPMEKDNSVERTVTVKGENFAATEDITFTSQSGTPLANIGTLPTSTVTAVNGAFSATITYPVGAKVGKITITATSATTAAYTDSADFMLTQAPPGQVENVGVENRVESLAVEWDVTEAIKPDSSVNPPVTEERPAASQYQVQWSKFGDPWDMTNLAVIGDTADEEGQTFHIIPDLDANVTYKVRVRASGMVDDTMTGYGAWSEVERGVPQVLTVTVPGPVRDMSLQALVQQQLNVGWTSPEEDGGADVTGYKLRYRVTGTNAWMPQDDEGNHNPMNVSTAGYVITGLSAGISHDVQVAAVNSVGTGLYTERTLSTLPAPTTTVMTMPSVVRSLAVVSATPNSLLVDWQVPADDGNAAITGYSVDYLKQGDTTWMPVTRTGTVTEQLITGLEKETTYTVRVAAVNSQGMGIDERTTGETTAVTVPIDNTLTPSKMVGSSDIPGAAVRLTLNAKLTRALDETISIKLAKFGLPSSIAASNVVIRGNKENIAYEGSPSGVTVSGSDVNLVLGSLKQIGGTKTLSSLDDARVTTVIIQQSAGITNPTVAGEYDVVFANASKDTAGINKATVNEKVTVKPIDGARGDEIVVTGKGFAAGAASVLLGSEVIASNVAIEDGSFEAVLTVGDDFKPGANVINAKDSSGNEAARADRATFTLKPKVTANPDSAAPTEEVTINVVDWSAGNITAIHFGGIAIKQAVTITDGKAEFKVTVPAVARIGINTVALRVRDKTEGSVNVTVKALDLIMDPVTVVPGQRVTITGTGFEKSTDVSSITIGGKTVTLPDANDRASTSNGRIAYTVTVPDDVGHGDKDVKVTVGAKTAIGALTVPEPAITVSPETSAPGTIISVQGSGFASGKRVEILYAGGVEEVGRADSSGNFTIRMEVPSDAGIGTTNKVKAQVRVTMSINASADHATPGSMITLPEVARVGTRITITGTNFEPFSVLKEVSVGGNDALPSPAPETDKNGAFSFEIRVPRLDAGSHTVTVKDGSKAKNSANETFTVVTTPVTYTPEEVFGGLIEAEVLVSVWRYSIDETGSDWDSFDPQFVNEPGINDLETVSKGDIVWIRVTENVADFQGATLYAGWNLITLE